MNLSAHGYVITETTVMMLSSCPRLVDRNASLNLFIDQDYVASGRDC
jgi:hypothetical protein